MMGTELEELQKGNDSDVKPNVMLDFLVPIMILVGTAIWTYIAKGGVKILECFIITVIYMAIELSIRKVFKSVTDLVSTAVQGMKSVMSATLILALAYCINTITKSMGAADFLLGVCESWMTPALFLSVTFIAGAVISFFTGSSWGTFAICIPIAVPRWVADMDCACAPCIVEAVQKRAAHPVYGYGVRQKPYYDAVMGWLKKRHGFEVNYEHLAFAPPGVIYAMNVMLRILTKPGDRVMVPMPNYDPLFDMVTRGGRKLVETPLVWKDGRYTFDFADMEAKAASGVKVLVLSSPHNPTGRVWTRQELEGVAEICLRHNIFMLVDEIHCDFVPPEHPHTTFGLLGEEVLRHSMVCYSSNKGFNLGGLGMATLVLADDDLRCKFNEEMSIAQTRLDNIFGMAALIAAYNDGEEWLDQAIAYVSDNKAYLDQFLRERIPQIRMIPSEGTYLVWLDCSQLPYRGMALEHFMINEAKVAFCAGYEFGEQGEAFLRMNVACPRCTLTKALEQMEKAINGLSLQ